MALRVGQTLYAFSLVVSLGIGVAGTIGAYQLNELKVGGPVYEQVVDGKDLLADIMPPPAFLIEAYLDLVLSHEGANSVDATQSELARLKTAYDERLAHWRNSALPADVKAALDAADRPAQQFWSTLETAYLPAAREGNAAAEQKIYAELQGLYAEHRKGIDALVATAIQLNGSLEDGSRSRAFGATLWQLGSVALALTVLLLGVLALRRRVIAPLVAVTSAMRALAGGRLEAEIPATGRDDEIGAMTNALTVFRTAETERRALAAQTETQRAEADAERDRRALTDQARTDELKSFVLDIDQGFAALSSGDLTARMTKAVAPEFEPIREKFNGTVETLDQTIGAVVKASGTIRTGLHEISVASNDLASRTEQQAASLEETVAALSEVTGTINETAAGARHAQAAAETTQKTAERGSDVVGRAVIAMTDIQKSSDEIGKIIGVIDEIAFQTNLLALNAGVEAARAGDAGRGFAVVAQEVRGLAQRSAEAAKQIKELISTSKGQVVQGVALVTTSGESLSEIMEQVVRMNGLVSQIAVRAAEQSVSLREVSVAADQMDKVTQQNAAMVEETTAAAESLTSETEELAGLVERFRTAGGGTRSAQPTAVRPPAARTVTQLRTVGQGGAAPKHSADEWAEF